MKKSLLVVVVLLCMASILAAMAYNSAYVQNPTFLKVASTDQALLAIQEVGGAGNLDMTAEVGEDGVMRFYFGRGLGKEMFGLQPGSGYTWDKLFAITNNSNETLSYRFTVSGNISPHITIRENPSEGNPGGLAYEDGNVIYRTINPGETFTFNVHIWDHQITPLENLEGIIQVNAFAQNPEIK